MSHQQQAAVLPDATGPDDRPLLLPLVITDDPIERELARITEAPQELPTDPKS